MALVQVDVAPVQTAEWTDSGEACVFERGLRTVARLPLVEMYEHVFRQ